MAFTSNWRVQNSSQLVNNVVLDVIEALDTAPKHTDRFQKNYFASTICSTTPKKIGDITYICLFPSKISIRGSKSGQERPPNIGQERDQFMSGWHLGSNFLML